MSHAFSDTALKEQEYIILSYCDLLVTRLKENVHGAEKNEVNIASASEQRPHACLY